MTGNASNAAEALYLASMRSYGVNLSQGTYSGHLIGIGSTRRAYLFNDVVYKVARCPEDDYINELEHSVISGLTVRDPLALPKTSLWSVDGRPVLAMQYIAGFEMGECFCFSELEPDHNQVCLPERILGMLQTLPLSTTYDTATGNVIRQDSRYWLVDFG